MNRIDQTGGFTHIFVSFYFQFNTISASLKTRYSTGRVCVNSNDPPEDCYTLDPGEVLSYDVYDWLIKEFILTPS